MVGTAGSVLIREVSLIQRALYREVPLYVFSFVSEHTYNIRKESKMPHQWVNVEGFNMREGSLL